MLDLPALVLGNAIGVLGQVVSYQPAAGGDAVSLKAIVVAGEQLAALPGAPGRGRTDGATLEVLVADLASPAAGDVVTTARGSFRVRGFHHPDPDALIWRLDCTPGGA